MLTPSTDLAALAAAMDNDPGLLRRLLREVDEQGWDGPVGTTLLAFALVEVVQPVVRMFGLRDAVARQAEATGWGTAWDTLRRSSIRNVDNPWGVVWVAVRRAVLSEMLAAAYGTQERTAWRLHSEGDSGCGTDLARTPRPVSLDVLAAIGREPSGDAVKAEPPCRLIDHLTRAFVDAGWPGALARRLIRQIALTAPGRSARTEAAFGWRHLAVELGIAPWQARRATLIVLGSPGGVPGLAERVLSEGVQVLQQDDVRRLLRRTLHYRKRASRAA